jgi:hypothetical protein
MINRGLGPMGAFPIGAIATFIGTPLTVGVGGAIAIVMAAYIAVGKSELKRVRMAGDNEGEKSSQAV